MTSVRVGAATHVGQRRQNNQDCIMLSENLYGVADGMGGHAGGEVASRTAVDAMKVAFAGGHTVDELAAAVAAANAAVMEKAEADPELHQMGTTVTAVAIIDGTDDEGEVLAFANVGDSRGYLMRDGILNQITEDHSVPQELLRAGQLTEEEAAVDPRRNQITRVLGLGETQPDIQTVVPYVGDRILLCSDGLTNEVTDRRITQLMVQTADPQELADKLVALANDNGGSDNITVVIVDVVDDDDRSAIASESLATSTGLLRDAPQRLLSAEERNAQLRELASEEPAGAPETVSAPPAATPTDAPSPTPTQPAGKASPAATTPQAPSAGGQPTATTEPAPEAAWAAAGTTPTEHEVPTRRFTGRVIIFFVVLLVVLGGIGAAIGWYARGSYFVGIDEGRVTIFQGRPGGLLWFDPTVAERTDLTEPQLLPRQINELSTGKEEPTLTEARRYIQNLEAEIEARRGTDATSSSSTSTTSTTSAPTTTAPTTVAPAPPP